MIEEEATAESEVQVRDTVESVASITKLELENLGPIASLSTNFSNRLNLITGDNGLGKSFLLEVVWWTFTNYWLNSFPYYVETGKPDTKIKYSVIGTHGSWISRHSEFLRGIATKQVRSTGNNEPVTKIHSKPISNVVVLYVQIDRAIAVFEPYEKELVEGEFTPRKMNFSREEIWEGQSGRENDRNRYTINGMISDLVNWQRSNDKSRIEIFAKTLRRLSPARDGDLGILELGEPQRVPNDAREIPTIKHPYGDVPITRLSAGVTRILSLAYILVWAWTEHIVKAKLAGRVPNKRMVVLIDEIEAHLHPKWQRLILPELLKVGSDLSADSGIEIQFVVATHSPLVLASLESVFDEQNDTLLHLDIDQQNNVILESMPYNKYGSIDNWLTSDVFELEEARSVEAENAIQEAKRVMDLKSPGKTEILAATEQLRQTLSNTDLFYPRWAIFAKRHGVEI